MFVFLLYFLFNVMVINSKILIRDSGLYPIKDNEIAMILFITVQNTCQKDAYISVEMIKCHENSQYSDNSDHIYLIGEETIISRGTTRNMTLIYPNLYLRKRSGTCAIKLAYEIDNYQDVLEKVIQFNTDRCMSEEEHCTSCDQDIIDDCNPVDCMVKYASHKSFFDRSIRECRAPTQCSFDSVYIPKADKCRKLDAAVCKLELEMIEQGHYEQCSHIYFRCHNGYIDNSTGECICDQGWTTAPCPSMPYQPNLAIYHMCNIELSSWEKANRQKLIITILAIIIFALAILAKMFIAVCLLNWCCSMIRSKAPTSEESCDIYQCPHRTCGDEVCKPEIPGGDLDKIRSSKGFRVSFSELDTISTDTENTEFSVSIAETGPSSSEIDSASEISCSCNKQ